MNKSAMTFAVVAIVCLGTSEVAHSTLLPSEPISLATRDKVQIALLACNRPFAMHDVIDAIRLLKTTQVYVDVTCEPFGFVEGHPLLKVANCDNSTGRWTCRGSDAVRLQLGGRDVVLSYDSRIDFKLVLEVVNYAVSVRSFNGRDVAARISGRCRLGDGKSVPFNGAVTFTFGCDDWDGTITRDCGGSKCRLFFTQFAE